MSGATALIIGGAGFVWGLVLGYVLARAKFRWSENRLRRQLRELGEPFDEVDPPKVWPTTEQRHVIDDIPTSSRPRSLDAWGRLSAEYLMDGAGCIEGEARRVDPSPRDVPVIDLRKRTRRAF